MTWPPPPSAAPPPVRAGRLQRVGAILAVICGLLVVVTLVASRIYRPVARMEGHAMSPFLQDGDRTLFFPVTDPIERGTVVMFLYPHNPQKAFAMRVVGLPGERLTIAKGVVRIGDVPLSEPYVIEANRWFGDFGPIQLGSDEFFVLGDNRRNASDSREWGPVERRFIQKRFVAVWYRRN